MKSHAKINIFLKILGQDERSYHLLSSRFVLIDDLYDELYFVKDKQNEGFEIITDFVCKDNIINKAYAALSNKGFKNELEEFFKTYSLKLVKNIPVFAGLGGGSSNCATFLNMLNESLNLKLSTDELIKLSISLGSDVAFFLSGFKSANVSGCGEIISEFSDDIPKIRLKFTEVKCDTNLVYKEFDRLNLAFKADTKTVSLYETLSTRELFGFENKILNDLFTPCVSLYPKMQKFMSAGYFLSGSGGTVFEVIL